ncbi:MAG: hypothetical protein JXQ93_06740 [Flavobacteriaceae bacterium]
MMKAFVNKNFLLLFFLSFVFNSCVDNLNFDQIEYSATPIYNSPIIFFDLDQNDFIDSTTNTDILTTEDITNFTYLETSFIRENLEKVELNMEVNNRFDRSFTFSFEFLDENSNGTHPIINFTVNPNEILNPVINPILIANNQDFLRTRKIRVRIEMSASTTPLSSTVIQNLSFKSTGTYFIRT